VNGQYRFELGEVVLGRELVVAADVDDLPAGALLPFRVHGQEHCGPGKQVGCRLLASEEERLALFQHVCHGDRLLLLPAACAIAIDHETQHVAEAVPRVLALLAAPADKLDERTPDLPVQPPRQPVLPGGQEPVARYEDLLERLGGGGHEVRLHAEHGAARVVAPAERCARDGLLRDGLEPLRYVHIHLAAGRCCCRRAPLLRYRRHRSADVRDEPLQKGHVSFPPLVIEAEIGGRQSNIYALTFRLSGKKACLRTRR
jgi:hypothetical protein